MQKIRIYTVSLGCPKNRVDTEKMLGQLGDAYVSAEAPEKSDLILINTCAFIVPAVEESLQEVIVLGEEAKKAGKQRPLIIVTGCLEARYGNQLHSLLPEVDIFLPISRQKRLVPIITRHFSLHAFLKPQVLTTGPAYGYIKLSEGCNNKCSFCTIPALRGRLCSRSLDSIEKDARALLEQGAKELVLVAQDCTAYGRDMDMRDGLIRVLDRLLELPHLQRLRLMYLYPSGLSKELLDFIRKSGPVMLPYFDIPLQHAHQDILRKMGRPFSQDPQKVVDRIRDRVPESVLRTTIIVGFPGENPEHFDTLISFVARNRFSNLGAFPYYPEEGTRAASMPDQVPEQIKQKRLDVLMQVQRDISAELLRAYEDQEVDVLVDAPHPEWPGLYTGRTWFQAPEVDGVTYVSGPEVIVGSMSRALVQETKDYDLVAMT